VYNCEVYDSRISMDAAAPEHLSCQLQRRHWTITDGNNRVENVSGEGVIGECIGFYTYSKWDVYSF